MEIQYKSDRPQESGGKMSLVDEVIKAINDHFNSSRIPVSKLSPEVCGVCHVLGEKLEALKSRETIESVMRDVMDEA